MTGTRAQLAEEMLRGLSATLRSAQLYSPGHPIIARSLDAFTTAVQALHAAEPSIVIGLLGDEIIVDETPMTAAEIFGAVVRRLKKGGVERISIDRGASSEELTAFANALITIERQPDGTIAAFPAMSHIRVGRVSIEDHEEAREQDMMTMKQMYGDAVSVASQVWESADTEGKPDATVARSMVDGLAQAVAQNRTGLLALTTLKNYDNYTFTHMVNVSILTMGQARSLGIDGPLLREFGLAALMHDIGKVRTPLEILNKPDKLTDGEFVIMKRHPIEGAEILRTTPEMPAMAPVVAFEHHLRTDGSGYPDGITRPSLNLSTMLCGIADVFDAMRSQRTYQKAFPTERILQVLKRANGTQFDQRLVRRFVQLIGIYPPGNLVRLNTGEVAVVLKSNAADTRRPQVRILFGSNGQRLEPGFELNLWEANPEAGPSSIVEPLDAADFGIDPLMQL